MAAHASTNLFSFLHVSLSFAVVLRKSSRSWPAQNNQINCVQGVTRVCESMQTCLLEDKTTISEYFPKPCPEQQDALSPQSKGEALLEIPCPLVSLVSQTIFLTLMWCAAIAEPLLKMKLLGIEISSFSGALRLKGQRLFWSRVPQSAVIRLLFIYP